MTDIKPRLDDDGDVLIDDHGVEVSFVQDGTRLRVFIEDEEWFRNKKAASLIDILRAEIEAKDGKVRALGAWKVMATEILFRLHINEAADEQDIIDARILLDMEE